MSDFVTALRRELVDAADRERRRGPARRSLARAVRPLAAAASVAALVLAAVLGLAVVGRDAGPVPAAPRTVGTIEVGGLLNAASFGDGALWVAKVDGSLVRVDAGSRRVTPGPDVGAVVRTLAASDGALWVAAERGPGTDVLRVDPQSGAVLARIATLPYDAVVLAADAQAAWYQISRQAPGPMRRVDAATGRVGGEAITRRMTQAVAPAGHVLWTLSIDGRLARHDTRTSRALGAAIQVGAPALGGIKMPGLAAEPDGAWVTTGTDGKLTRVTADGAIAARVDAGASGPLALAGGRLWAIAQDVSGRRVALLRLDPATGAEQGRLDLGSRHPVWLGEVRGALWALLDDGTIRIVR